MSKVFNKKKGITVKPINWNDWEDEIHEKLYCKWEIQRQVLKLVELIGEEKTKDFLKTLEF